MMMKQLPSFQNRAAQNHLFTQMVLFGIAKALICGSISTKHPLLAYNRE